MHPVSQLICPFKVRTYSMLKTLRFFRDVANVQIFQMLQELPTFSVVNVAVPSNVAILRKP